MEQAGNKNIAAKILKVLSLLLLIFFALVMCILLFTTLPMLFIYGKVQVDSGGLFDLLLQRVTHGTATIDARLLFLGALPMLLNVLLLLADSIVLFSFLKQVVKRGVWVFAEGKRRWVAASVISALCAVVPAATGAIIKPAIAASNTFVVKAWNPTSGILLFVLTCAITVLYFIKTNRRLSAQQAESEAPGEETA